MTFSRLRHNVSKHTRTWRLAWPVLSVAWAALVCLGLIWLAWTKATPGATPTLIPHWPANSHFEHNIERPTLLVFAHPQCPCTRATFYELGQLVANCLGKADVRVLFFKPEKFPDAWEKTDQWNAAASIPGVKVAWDEDGLEAERFGAVTSGHSLLYSPQGELLFSGGITSSRGHAGENSGRSTIESILMQGAAEHSHTVTFGCPIGESSRTSRSESN